MTTPQRALELAGLLDKAFDTESVEHLFFGDIQDAAAILRAYADLSKKWQSVLNAEVVAKVMPSATFPGNHMLDYPFAIVNDLAVGTQLIIKPAP